MEVSVRPATLHDMETLSASMREADRLEVMASGSYTPSQAVIDSVESTECPKALFFGEDLVGMFGVVTAKQSLAGIRIGAPWVLTTNVVSRHSKTFVRETKRLLPSLFAEHDVLVNFVDDRYDAAIRWLRLLGFWVGEPEPFGPNGEPFRPFVMKREALRV